jgi:hypothetical protein
MSERKADSIIIGISFLTYLTLYISLHTHIYTTEKARKG